MIPHGTSHNGGQRYRMLASCLVIVILTVSISLAGSIRYPDSSRTDLTAAERKALIKGVCSRIEKIYPFEEIGRTTREGLLRNYTAGEYDHVLSRAEFAVRVTADLEDLSRDKHLDLYYDPVLAAELIAREKAGNKQVGETAAQVERARWENFGFKAIRMLDGQVGYLDLRMFYAAKYAGGTAAAAIEFLSGSKAVVVDLRLNGGGWDDMVTLLSSYFVDRNESEILAITQSTLDKSYYASVVPSFVPGKRLTGIPVYILTSSRTASAAEAFTSIVRHLNSDVVVVGQRTAGAENPVGVVALDSQFVLKIPCYRKIYFGGRLGWEGTGLTPDVEVSSDRALETAHLHALHTLQSKLTDSLAQEKIQWAIDGYQAVLQPKTVELNILQSYAGRYGKAQVAIEGENLCVQFEHGPRKRLLPISANYFLIEGRDDLRLRFVTEHGRIIAIERIYSDGYRNLDMRQ